LDLNPQQFLTSYPETLTLSCACS